MVSNSCDFPATTCVSPKEGRGVCQLRLPLSFSKVRSRKFYSKPEFASLACALVRELPARERGRKIQCISLSFGCSPLFCATELGLWKKGTRNCSLGADLMALPQGVNSAVRHTFYLSLCHLPGPVFRGGL